MLLDRRPIRAFLTNLCMLLPLLPSVSTAFMKITLPRDSGHDFKPFRVSFSHTASSASTSSGQESSNKSVPAEIQVFESWFSSIDGSWLDSGIRHGMIGKLRGLLWNKNDGKIELATRVATIPRSVVLSTDYSQGDWDSKLAVLLWKSVAEGGNSPYAGYCNLLMQGSMNVSPTSTAPNALRRWSSDQKLMLGETVSGKKLLQLEVDQTKAWRTKYNSINEDITWDQFQWAMEAVHSRAFCGVQTLSILPSLAAPVVALGALLYAYNTLPPSEIPLVAVMATAVSVIPTILQQRMKSAVLLPLIDSANHLEAADSSIDFDPLKGSFELSIGPNCLVQENDGSTQLYISYGPKNKEELLLNYGFLPGVPVDLSDNEYRRHLAESYQR